MPPVSPNAVTFQPGNIGPSTCQSEPVSLKVGALLRSHQDSHHEHSPIDNRTLIVDHQAADSTVQPIFSLAAVTATAMGVATFGQSAFGVLASNLIEEFRVDRWQIGILVTASGFTGALLSPSSAVSQIASAACVP